MERLLKIQEDTKNEYKESLQTVFLIHRTNQKTLDKALNKINGERGVNKAIELIKSFESRKVITKDEAKRIEDNIEIIYNQKPELLKDLKEYFMDVSSSVSGSLVLEIIKNLGFI